MTTQKIAPLDPCVGYSAGERLETLNLADRLRSVIFRRGIGYRRTNRKTLRLASPTDVDRHTDYEHQLDTESRSSPGSTCSTTRTIQGYIAEKDYRRPRWDLNPGCTVPHQEQLGSREDCCRLRRPCVHIGVTNVSDRASRSDVLPETEVTVYSGDMGDTRPLLRRGHALEGVSRHGRASSVCGPPARGRNDGGAVRGVRDLPEDGLQDLPAVPADRGAGPHRPQPAARIATRISCRWWSRRRSCGSSGSIPAGARRRSASGSGSAGPRSTVPPSARCMRSSTATGSSTRRSRRRAPAPHGDAALLAGDPESAVVRRLQGRVPARQSAVLLSADDHRLRQPLSARVRGPLDDQGTLRLHRLRARVSGLSGCPRRSARTTACPSPPRTRCTG